MFIRMLTEKRGCPDGFTSKLYEFGKVYEAPQSLAAAFVNAGDAQQIHSMTPSPTEEVEFGKLYAARWEVIRERIEFNRMLRRA